MGRSEWRYNREYYIMTIDDTNKNRYLYYINVVVVVVCVRAREKRRGERDQNKPKYNNTFQSYERLKTQCSFRRAAVSQNNQLWLNPTPEVMKETQRRFESMNVH